MFHYTIVRSDLPPGLKAANLVHGAGGSAAPLGRDLPDDTRAVALQATPTELLWLEERLKAIGVPHHAQREDDDDPSYPGQLMAIGVRPCERGTVRRLISSFGLVR